MFAGQAWMSGQGDPVAHYQGAPSLCGLCHNWQAGARVQDSQELAGWSSYLC